MRQQHTIAPNHPNLKESNGHARLSRDRKYAGPRIPLNADHNVDHHSGPFDSEEMKMIRMILEEYLIALETSVSSVD